TVKQFYIPAWNLDKFIEDYLLPDTRFRRQVRQAVHIISTFLKERCFQDAPHPVRVSKVVKGGSSGKGTTLRGRSDADLVVFLSNLTSFQEQLDHRGTFIREIKRQLEACQEEETFAVQFEVQSLHWERPRALSFVLRSPQLQEGVEFDVLPAFDVLGERPLRNTFGAGRLYLCSSIKLIQECQDLDREGEFPPPCFTELHLILLVKHWYQLCKEKLGKPLPPQYALELLTVYAWERGNKQTDFSTARGFQTVLVLVLNYRELCIYWTNYYDFENPTIKQYLKRQLNKSRPVILDPADPTGNVAGKDRYSWQRLAEEARVWLGYPCFTNRDGSPVVSWNVQVICDCALLRDVGVPHSREEAEGPELGSLPHPPHQGRSLLHSR
uniref:2'-5' oligoadenylate synthase n=1 Tax=Panthera leo TaxID=9689 RepID=A0A8C9D918_PANLE